MIGKAASSKGAAFFAKYIDLFHKMCQYTNNKKCTHNQKLR